MNENQQLKKKTVSNMIWRFAERSGAQGVGFIVSIILARLLDPSVYGTVALLTVFTTILNVFVDSGLGNALIQKKDADQLDFSTVFIINMVMCLVLYIILFISSPYISSIFKNPELTPLMRVLGLTLVIAGIKNIQQAYVSRHLMFKKFFYSTLGGTIIAAMVGISLAYLGFGAWALVMQQIVNAIIDTCILYITVKWKPQLRFSFQRFYVLFSYGWKLLVSSLLDTIYNEFRQLVIGKYYSASDLAYYNQGEKFPKLIISNLNSAIDSVLLPVMSQAQDEKERLKAMTRRSIKTSIYILAPLMVGLSVTAPQLVSILLTDKWLDCVPYMIIFCFTYLFWPIHTANLNAIKAMGRSDIYLKLEVIKKFVGFISIFIALWFGPLAIALSVLVVSIISQIINSWPNRKLMNYGYLEQLKDVLPALLLACFMGICTVPLNYLMLNKILILIMKVLIGMGIYLGGSALFKLESFRYLVDLIKKKK